MANDLTQQMVGSVARMNPARRLLTLGGLIGVIAAVVGVGMWASEPAWVVMYQDVGLAEAGQMTTVLDKAGIPNKLAVDGSAVMVGRDDHARARVELAKAQLPRSGRPGWELFDGNAAWGMTEFTQRITYQRALEGELARSISATAGIDRAEVHLTMPEPGALRRADRPAKAAVLLRMRPGMVLAPGAVQGIIATVAASVDRLSAENIAVTDDSGRLLSASGDDTGMGGASRRMEIQRSIEDYLVGKTERLLASVSGLGVPRVQVAAQINFDQVERTIESFDPDAQVLQSEGRSETEATADGSGAQTVINNTYQNSRKLEKIVTGGAGITRLTVAVLVDERRLTADTTATTPIPARLANVEMVVKNAIGFDSTRGDRITVTAVPFEIIPVDTTTQVVPSDVMGTVERLVRPAVGLVGIIVLALVALRAAKSLQPVRQVSNSVDLGRRSAESGSEAVIPPLGPPPETVLLKNRVVEETNAKPELMAQVVRAWMGEG
ncbi:MAG: flagellar basal-body MS-ring/collar protein FliF [Gemmatimonadales bacterium]